MRKNTIKKAIIILILTLISLTISYSICEHIAFNSGLTIQQKIENKLFRIIFMSYTIFLIIAWSGIVECVNKIKNKDRHAIVFLKHFLIYFSIMFVLLLIMWPGHWVWDELYVIKYTETYSIFMWQSVITQIYYAIALLIFPNVVSIVILQVILISLVIAYIQMKVETIYNKKIFNIILYILLLLPAVIINNIYILRLPMYSYILLLFFAIVLFNYIEKKKFTTKKIIFLILLSIIITLWRSEGMIFIIFIPAIMAFSYKDIKEAVKIAGIFFIALIISYVSFNKIFEENEDKSYSLLVYVNPLSNMLQENLELDEEDLKTIDKVMDVELIKQNPSYTETPSYWTGNLIRENYKNNLEGVTKSYAKIILKNPVSFMKARLATFFASSGMDKKVIPQVENRFLYHLSGLEKNEFIQQFCDEHKSLNSLFKDLKIGIESFLIGENVVNENQNQFVKVVFWNFIPVLIGIFIIGIFSIIKKKWLIALLSIALLAKSAIVFLTAPASYFMYYFPEYITGFVLICITIYEKNSGKEYENDRITKEK